MSKLFSRLSHRFRQLGLRKVYSPGLEALGFSITATLLAELSILAIGTGTGLQAVKEFCQFTAIALVIDYMLQLTFFVSVLSVDIRRVEVSIFPYHFLHTLQALLTSYIASS